MNYKTGGSKNRNAAFCPSRNCKCDISKPATAAEQGWRLPFKGQTEGRSCLPVSASVNEVLASCALERDRVLQRPTHPSDQQQPLTLTSFKKLFVLKFISFYFMCVGILPVHTTVRHVRAVPAVARRWRWISWNRSYSWL